MTKKYDTAVIGTIFVDIKGFPQYTYDPSGRNLGEVHFYHGGVGRNVAETMGQLDIKLAFVSTVDHSGLGQEVLQRLQKQGIDTTYIEAYESKGMGMWMAILDEKGDLAGSISQMPSLELMQQAIFKLEDQFLAESKSVVLEIDLNEQIAQSVVTKSVALGLPLFGIPGNLDVLNNRLDLLQHFQCFICNDIEAEKLTGIAMHTEEEIRLAGRKFTDLGLNQIVITRGAKGSYYFDSVSKEEGFCAAIPVKVVDTTGAGDSFFAGTIAALLQGESLGTAVQLGSKVAAITISSSESTCQDLQSKLNNPQDWILQPK